MKKAVLKFFVVFGILWLSCNYSYATTYTYIGANNGTWSTTSNWSGGTHYPGFGAGDQAVINSNVTINVTAALPNGLSQLTCNDGITATIKITSGVTFNINGSSGAILVGSVNGNGASLTLSASGGTTASVNIGTGTSAIGSSSGTATLNVSANVSLAFASGTLNVGNNSSSITNSGTVSFTSCTINLSHNLSELITNSGGTFNVTSSSVFLSGNNSNITNSGTFSVTTSNIYLDTNPCNITNNPTGSFTINASNVIFNNFSNCYLKNFGTFTAKNGSNITISAGATDCVIYNYGTFYAGQSGSQCIISLLGTRAQLDNTTGVFSATNYNGNFYLGSTSIIYPTATDSQIVTTTSCTFTLQSDANGSASIAKVFNTTNGCTGTFNVERYFQGSATYDNVKHRWLARNYRIISSPVNTGTPIAGTAGTYYIYGLNYIVGATAGLTTTANSTTNAFVTGATGGSTPGGNPSMYLFRENRSPSNVTFTSGNFIGITNITSPTAIGTSHPGTWTIPAGNGVLFYYRGNASSYATRTVSPYIAPENTTLTATGNLNQQLVAVYDWFTPNSANLSYTSATANTAVRGFNMVGNPYACSIDWNTAFSGTGITRTNINPTIYVFNPVTNQYDSYMTTSTSGGVSNGGGTDGSGNATNIIASGQGFFVQANSGGAPVLTFTENAKAPTSQVTGSSLLMGSPAGQNVVQQLMRLRLGIDSLNYDYIAIAFNSSASSSYNGEEDAEYLPGIGAMVGLSSLSSDGKNLAINSLPLPTLKQQVIKLDVEAVNSGTYTLQRTTLNAIPQIYKIWLIDNYKKDSLDIRNNTTYTFNIDKTDTASFGANRFSIVLREDPALGLHLLNFTATKVTDGTQNIWVTENEQNYTDFTVERSTDNGATFTVLGGMMSSAQGTYNFVDKNPQNGTDQYRLKMIDLNGTVTYSKVITLLYSDLSNTIEASNISIYPNPSSGIINLAIKQNDANAANTSINASTLQTLASAPSLVSLPANTSSSYTIKMVNITGTVVKTAISPSANWQDNVSSLMPGTYIIQVVNNMDNSVVGKSTFIKL